MPIKHSLENSLERQGYLSASIHAYCQPVQQSVNQRKRL
jgi:hypothetical protein